MNTLTYDQKCKIVNNILDKTNNTIVTYQKLCVAEMEKQKTFVLDLDKEYNYGMDIAKLKVKVYQGMYEHFDLVLYPQYQRDDPTSTIITSHAGGIMLAKHHSVQDYIDWANKANSQEIQKGEKVMILVVSKDANVCFAFYAQFGNIVRPMCSSPIPVNFYKGE